MLIPDFGNPSSFFITFLVLFLIINTRFFLTAGFFYLFFYKWYKKKWFHKKINTRNYSPSQLKREIKWSIMTALIFAFTGTMMFVIWQKGYTNIYLTFHSFDLFYIPFSLLLILGIHETYYYWMHRWMHLPKIFRLVHRVHHESKITTPFTASSFHPLEAILQGIFFPLILLTIPMHLIVLGTLLTIMTVSSVINHLDIEIFPENFNRHNIGKWFIGATHHSLHHMKFKKNFGLYFTFWDKILKTESESYDKLYDSVSRKK